MSPLQGSHTSPQRIIPGLQNDKLWFIALRATTRKQPCKAVCSRRDYIYVTLTGLAYEGATDYPRPSAWAEEMLPLRGERMDLLRFNVLSTMTRKQPSKAVCSRRDCIYVTLTGLAYEAATDYPRPAACAEERLHLRRAGNEAYQGFHPPRPASLLIVAR